MKPAQNPTPSPVPFASFDNLVIAQDNRLVTLRSEPARITALPLNHHGGHPGDRGQNTVDRLSARRTCEPAKEDS